MVAAAAATAATATEQDWQRYHSGGMQCGDALPPGPYYNADANHDA